MDIQEHPVDNFSLEQIVQELTERVKKLENPEYLENKNFNNKLSSDIQKIVKNVRGPLKPEEFLDNLINDAFVKNKKETFAVIRKYPNNIHEVKNQFSQVLENIENRIAIRKRDNILDDKINKKISKFIKILEEHEKVKKENEKPKIQSTMDQFLENNSDIIHNKNDQTSTKVESAKKSGVCKQKNPAKQKQAEKSRRKRKARNEDEDYESCSSQEVEVEQITASMKKRFKLSSSQESNEQESNVELDAQESNSELNAEMNTQESIAEKKSVEFKQYRVRSPIIRSEESQSSQSDETSEDYSAELFAEIKTTVMKEIGKRSKQQKLRGKENVPEYNKNENTVYEKELPLRKKTLR